MNEAMDDPEIANAVARGARHTIRTGAPVSEWTIRAWCGALGDLNSTYLDDDAARRDGHGGIIAPPVMMHGYTLPTLLSPEGDTPAKNLRKRFHSHGFTGVVAVSYEQNYVSPIRVGDSLTREVWIESVSDEKSTALGSGHFVTTAHRITNQRDQLIGTMKVRVLYFRPGKQAASPARRSPASISMLAPVDSAITIPPLEIPVTATLVVSGALASNDFERVHHDRDLAQSQGMKDIFMNILTSSGLVTRYVTDWAGPDCVLNTLSVRLNAPNHPGDTMVISGWADQPRSAGKQATICVRGVNSIGVHIDATVAVIWPEATTAAA